MNNISDDNVGEILKKSEYHFFYFSARWCGPCKSLLPLVEELSNRNTNENLIFHYVDIDTNDKLCDSCKIKQVPSYAVIKDKKVLGIDTGANITKVGNLLKECLNKDTLNILKS
jgi:thioredoxin 1